MLDSIVKNLSVLTAVATLVGSAIVFFAQRSDELQQRLLQPQVSERESKRVFLEKQADLYFEIVPLVSKLALAESTDQINAADEARFWHVFLGELGMVEDADVATAMDLFGTSLEAFQGKRDNRECAGQRRAISLVLSHCVRMSLGTNWGVELEDVTTNRCSDDVPDDLRAKCPSSEEATDPKQKRPARGFG